MMQTDLRTKLSIAWMSPLLATFIICDRFIAWATTKKVVK